MTRKDILEDLKRITSIYKPILLDVPNFEEFEEIISWKNYKPAIYKSMYFREYEQLLHGKQYSFLLADKSFIQFYYLFSDAGILSKAKLAYYPYPLQLKETSNEIEYYINDSSDAILEEYYYDLWNVLNSEFSVPISDKKLLAEINFLTNEYNVEIDLSDYPLKKFENKYKITNSSHIRIDYNSKEESHHKCEMQIGAVNYIRFPLEKLISPFVFFDFIIKNLSKEYSHFENYQEIKTKSNFNTNFAISKKNAMLIDNFYEDSIFIKHE